MKDSIKAFLCEFIDKPIVFRDQVRFLRGTKKTLIVNLETRYNLFLANEVLYIFEQAEKDGLTYSELINAVHEDDQDYICEVISQLFDHFFVEGSMPPFSSKYVEITLDITGECNLHCRHCCVSAGDQIKGEDLSTERLKSIIDRIIEFNPKGLSISGGEPLVRSDFTEIITYIHERYSGKMELMTNGTLITQKMAKFIGEMFDSVSVSIDGVDEESCSIIRGKGTFKACMDGLNLLQKETQCKLSLSMVVCRENEEYVRDFYSMCKKLGVIPLVRALSPSERLSQNSDTIHLPEPETPLSGEMLTAYIQECRKNMWNKKPPETFSCQAARRQFEIDYRGNIYPCPALMDDDFLLGNIFSIQNFSDYILGEEYKNSLGYRNLQKYLPFELDRCKECNKNLLCGTCVAMIRDDLKQGTYYDHCEENKHIFDLFWEE